MTELEIDIQVRATAQALATAALSGDVEKVISMYWPDSPYIEQGVLTERFSYLESSIRTFFKRHRVTETTLSNIRVIVLGPKVAVLTTKYKFSATSRRGAIIKNDGAWSAVFVHDGAAWRIIAPHQSVTSDQAQMLFS